MRFELEWGRVAIQYSNWAGTNGIIIRTPIALKTGIVTVNWRSVYPPWLEWGFCRITHIVRVGRPDCNVVLLFVHHALLWNSASGQLMITLHSTVWPSFPCTDTSTSTCTCFHERYFFFYYYPYTMHYFETRHHHGQLMITLPSTAWTSFPYTDTSSTCTCFHKRYFFFFCTSSFSFALFFLFPFLCSHSFFQSRLCGEILICNTHFSVVVIFRAKCGHNMT